MKKENLYGADGLESATNKVVKYCFVYVNILTTLSRSFM